MKLKNSSCVLDSYSAAVADDFIRGRVFLVSSLYIKTVEMATNSLKLNQHDCRNFVAETPLLFDCI